MATLEMPPRRLQIPRYSRRLGRLLVSSWRLFRETRLGMAGFAIVLAFVAMAILAPVLAPHSPDFLAPREDVFSVSQFTIGLQRGLTPYPPVMGPTTPLFPGAGGGVWAVMAAREGQISMVFLTKPQRNETPLRAGDTSLSFGVSDLGLTPPLSSVLYLAPGQAVNGSLGERKSDGLLAFAAGRTFVIYNPFSGHKVFEKTLNFTPRWVTQDPASAGLANMIPAEQVTGGFVGTERTTAGPFRYVTIANESHLVIIEVQYLYNKAPIKGIKTVLDGSVEVTGEPLPYYNHDKYFDSIYGIYVPTSNGRLLAYDITGVLRRVVDLRIGGGSANITAPLGFSRGAFPYHIYLPAGGPAGPAVLVLSPGGQTSPDAIKKEIRLGGPGARITLRPETISGDLMYVGVTEGTQYKVLKVDISSGKLDSTFVGDLPEPPKDIFFVGEISRVYALVSSGRIYSSTILTGGSEERGFQRFPDGGGGNDYAGYAGSPGGTIYATNLLGGNQVWGYRMKANAGELVFYQFLGFPISPLAPGVYPSGNRYWLGTDHQGHDILSWLLYGSRIALLVGILAAMVAVGIGTMVGVISGYFGRWVDTILMRVTDIALVLPFLPIVLIFAAILQRPSVWVIVLVIAILGWPGIARVIRAQTLSLKQRPFIDAARVSGSGSWRLIFVHITPNVLPFTLLYMTLTVSGAILIEAAVSFLGLGDPNGVSWGIMLQLLVTSQSTYSAWWWLLPPGLSITFLSLGFFLISRGMDEILNPRLRRR